MKVKEAVEGSIFLACQTARKAKTLTGVEDDKRQQTPKGHNKEIKV